MKFWLWLLAVLVVLTLVSVTIEDVAPVHAWVLHVSGADDVSGPEYGWWSGFGSVFPWSLDTVVALWVIVWHHARAGNCHVHGCWRVGTLPVGDYKVCRKHHFQATGTRVDMEHLKLAHHLHRRKKLLDAGFKPEGP